MEAERKRLTLDLEPAFHRRLKAISALKGTNMRGYCQAAIDWELTKDESEVRFGEGFDRQSFERAVVRRQELFAGRPLLGDSVDLIRESHELREAETKGWA